MPATSDLFAGIPSDLPNEFMETLASGNGTTIERIVSKGHCSPADFWYDQQQHEWVLLVKGEAVLHFKDNDRLVHLKPGMHVMIPAHEKHRVAWTKEDTETVWLAVFFD